jgi:hypothetical protein
VRPLPLFLAGLGLVLALRSVASTPDALDLLRASGSEEPRVVMAAVLATEERCTPEQREALRALAASPLFGPVVLAVLGGAAGRDPEIRSFLEDRLAAGAPVERLLAAAALAGAD